ncbi:expressed unknown protein [Seminavis robusta]|uniref:Uncharacterized protein n=1 Tax=Seminavis robusta TaxID=568900 RepID=A0A9N8DWY2_9STRA|nr:expressed unknown protein [Seminavis robusta]|eukprot:Sro407_g136630.1 n/a (1358) ;mRNA; f:23924-28754
MTSNNNNIHNNRSWLSSSSFGSQDDLSTEDNHNHNNHHASFGSARKPSRDRYNHYRRDGPAKVRPWMRDKKAVTGSSSSGRLASSAFRVGSRPVLLSEATSGSVCSNSCGNSVSSQSSFPDQQQQQRPLPREVGAAPVSSKSVLSMASAEREEDVSMLTLKEDVSMITTSVAAEEEDETSTKQQPTCVAEESYLTVEEPVISHHGDKPAADTQSVQLSVEAVQDENATVDSDGESAPDSPPPLVPSLDDEDDEEATNDDASKHDNKDNQEKTAVEAEKIVESESSPQEEATSTEIVPEPPSDSAAANDNADPVEMAPKETDPAPALDKKEETSPFDEETVATNDIDIPETNHPEEAVQTTVEPEIPASEPVSTSMPTAPEEPPKTMRDPHEHHEEKSQKEEEVYDVLVPVQPTSYNPMAFQRPTSVAAYATLEKPTPLVKEQAALLNDAIHEVASEEEQESFDEYDDVTTPHNISTDSLLGVQALDTTHEDSVLEGVMEEDDELNISAEEDEFLKMWPKSVDLADLPEVDLPADWNEQQMLAVVATQTWIRSQQQQPVGSPSKEDPKATYCSYFAAALSHCPALTTAFYADDESSQSCFCPCSAQMGSWRSHRLSAKEEKVLFGETVKCESRQFTPVQLLEHCHETTQKSDDTDSRFLHSVVHKYLEALFGETHEAFDSLAEKQKAEMEAAKQADAVTVSKELVEELDQLRAELERVKASNNELTDQLKVAAEQTMVHEAKSIATTASVEAQAAQIKDLTDASRELATSNQELLEKLKAAEENGQSFEAKNAQLTKTTEEQSRELQDLKEASQSLAASNQDLLVKLKSAEEKGDVFEAKSLAATASSGEQAQQIKALKESSEALKKTNAELSEKLATAEKQRKENEEKSTTAAASVAEQEGRLKEQEERLKKLDEEILRFSKSNEELTEKLKATSEKLQDAHASSKAQADMMNAICEEMKLMEEKKTELEQKLKDSDARAKDLEEKHAAVTTAENEALDRIRKLEVARNDLDQANLVLTKKLKGAEEREQAQASRDENACVVNVGDMSVDLRRFQVQCQKYFSTLRVVQLKSHCIRDKSPAKFTVPCNPKNRAVIDIQALLDKGAAIESQDATYMFRSLDTFNKGHFHTHKLLLPWKIVGGDGNTISRAQFFSQVWEQLGGLKVNVTDKKTEVPLFQDSLGTLIPMPNAVLEGMLRVTPAELDRVFAARLAPYYRAIGRLMVQCVGATADDGADYRQKIAGSALPYILRQKLFRGVDPVDESYPLEDLLDHAFSLLGMEGMTRDRAFEYFGIEAKDYNDTAGAVKRIREEVHEMWIKERSLALKALEEGLTLSGLADLSFCCGLVPLEAVNEVIFTQ